ncbi:hypothetical protein EC957_004179 [Mortierella hygrophila]|uniref:F-box domain-containing protein n=1 Tax=Mortierella hygrophila TaxID=979708 RepID=A0A9P6FIJ2_9FUNG|nr:hypothetical protein EC957_004179 [Mortierella hygrophila]
MSPTSHEKRASALEIPLISDLICKDLTRKDLFACIQVSHHWHDAFQPQLDRFVRLDTNPRKSPPHLIRQVLDRAAQIRSLQVDISDGGWFLPKEDSVIAGRSGSTMALGGATAGRCINLQELSCLDFGYQPRPGRGNEGYFYHAPDRPSIVPQSSNALRLIQHSPKLQFLYIHHARQFYRTDHFSTEVLEAISNHKSLRRIKIHLEYAVDDEFRMRLLQHLPEGIEDFELVCRPSQVSRPPPPQVIDPAPLLSLKRLCLLSDIPRQNSSSDSRSSYWDQARFLKDDFSEFRYGYPDWLIIPLTKQSPQLSKLAIAGYHGYPNTLLQSLVESCPDLDTIHLGGTNCSHHPTMHLLRDIPYYHNDDDMVPAIWDRTPLKGVFEKLREFMATGFSNNMWSDRGYEDVSGLLVRSTETLERVFVQSDDGGWSHPIPFRAGRRGDGLSWADCKELKELTIEPISRMNFSFLDKSPIPPSPPPHSPPDPDSDSDDDGLFNNLAALADNNSINTAFKSLTNLRLTSLGDPDSCNCSRIFFDYSRYWSQTPTLDDYLEQPPQKYSEAIMRSYHHHRVLFIRRMRELFGRLKAVGSLKKVDLDWSDLCIVVKSMTQEVVLELLKNTEDKEEGAEKDICTDSGLLSTVARSDQGWYGPMTLDDLAWLGLQWPTRAEILAEKEKRQLQ